MTVQITQLVFIVIGATLVGLSTTWMMGLGVGLLAHALMPAEQA
jgi:predicted anti-sigma-YlaC factor YlaD